MNNTATCQRRENNTEALIKLLKRDKDIFTTEYEDAFREHQLIVTNQTTITGFLLLCMKTGRY